MRLFFRHRLEARGVPSYGWFTPAIVFMSAAVLAWGSCPGCAPKAARAARTASPASPLSMRLSPAPLPDIEVFMQIGANHGPALSPDGDRLFFRSAASGTSQLYRILSNGWPSQLTFFPEGVDYVSFDPGLDWAVLSIDSGGNEQYQLYLLDTESGEVRPLTNDPLVRHSMGVWAPDGMRVYYSANVLDRAAFHIYEMDLVTGTSRVLIERAGSNGVTDVSPDGGKLIFYSATSNQDSNLYLYDVARKETTLLTPHEGDRFYGGGAFTSDGRHAFITTDDNPERIRRLARLDLGTLERKPFPSDDASWPLEDIALSRNRRFLAWVLNEDGYGRLHLFDLEHGKPLPTPQLDGIISSPDPTDLGLLAFSFNSPTLAPDVWIYDFREAAEVPKVPSEFDRARSRERAADAVTTRERAVDAVTTRKWAADIEFSRLEGCVQVTFASYAGVDPSIFHAPRLVRYRSFDGLEIPAFLYLPTNYAGGPIPFIIEAHGGPTSQFRPAFNRHFQYLMQHGFGLFAPNFRGSTGYGRAFEDADNYRLRLDSVHDVAEAARWLLDQNYARPGQIGIKGASYGGYMTLAAMTEYPDLFAAGLNQVGIANFETFLSKTADYRRSLRESEYGPLDDVEFLRSISPIHKADQIQGALFVVHGENDPRVPVGEARQILTALRSRGVPVDSLIFPDEGHGIARRENRLVFYSKMVEFFKTHLGAGAEER